jgi:hypothetical protein
VREEILYAQHAALCYVVEVVNVLPTRNRVSSRIVCGAQTGSGRGTCLNCSARATFSGSGGGAGPGGGPPRPAGPAPAAAMSG